MKRLYYVFAGLTVPWFILMQYSPWASVVIGGIAMLLTAYYFYATRLAGAQHLSVSLQQEVAQLQTQLDASIEKEERACREAVNAKTIKRHLLATVNHEIRTPMSSMLGMTDLLRDTALTGEQREYIDTIKFCGENLLSTITGILVNDLLDFSKFDRDGEKLTHKDFELRNCVNEVLMMFAGKISADGPELSYSIATHTPVQLNGDRKRLSQILMNLVENAIRHTKEGEICLVIGNPVTRPDNKVVIEFQVRDTGCGIADNQLVQLFKGVIQTDTPDTAGMGPKGLGLVVSKKLVEMMDGDISVESQVGKGSIFTFTVAFNPALKPKHSPVMPASSETAEKIIVGLHKKGERKNLELSEGFSEIFPLRILLAEDNEINQQLTLKILAKLGYRAALAHHGKEVLEMVAHEDYDVILMDVQMPEMDGLEATRMVRLCLQRQPVIIAMTANSMDGDHDDCIQAGMDDYISKPVELDELIRQLEKWGRAIQLKKPLNT